MQKRKAEKIFVICAAGLAIFGIIYFQNSNNLFSLFTEQLSDVNWDEVRERDIVKNSIPIILLEESSDDCKVSAIKFDYIVDHEYFIRSGELVNELHYDRENETLLIPCTNLNEEKSRLNVWYVIEESPKHPTKYEYFVTVWEDSDA